MWDVYCRYCGVMLRHRRGGLSISTHLVVHQVALAHACRPDHVGCWHIEDMLGQSLNDLLLGVGAHDLAAAVVELDGDPTITEMSQR